MDIHAVNSFEEGFSRMSLSTRDNSSRTSELKAREFPASVKFSLTRASQIARDAGLDFTKGMLVVLMMAYHAGVFFILDPSSKSFVLDIVLDFVSGSWVFLSGLLVSASYRIKFAADPSSITMRLWGRATKILALFFALNAVIYWYHLIPHPSRTLSPQVIGNILWYGGGDLASFEVLVGISYTLFLSPVVLGLRKWGPVFVGAFVGSCVLVVMSGGRLSPNGWLVVCGLGGMLCGYLFSSTWLRTMCETAGGQTGGLICAILATAVYYALQVALGYTRADIHVYLFGVTSIFFAMYFSYSWVVPNSTIDHILRMLGQYSLVCYIGQMGLLWGLYAWGRFYLPNSYWLMLTIAVSIMVVSVNSLHYILNRNKPLRGAYTAIFG